MRDPDRATARERAGRARVTLADVGRGGVAVAVAGVAVNALAYLVPVLGARRLDAGDLGALATAMAVAATASVIGLGLQTALAVGWARHGRVANAGRATLGTAAVSAGLLALAAPALALAMHLPIVLVLLIAASTAAVVVASRSLGHFQGTERFGWLAVGMVLLAVGRYGGVIAALWLGADLTRAVLAGAVVAGCVAGALVLADRLAGAPALTSAGAAVPVRARDVLMASSATLAMLVLSSADLLLARAVLSPAASGAYAVGSVLAKGALWAPQVVTVLVLPRLARGGTRALPLALGLVAGSGTALTLAALVAGRFAMGLAGGPSYQQLGGYAVGFAVVGSLYAVVFVLVNAEIAAGVRWPALSLWAGAAALALVVALLPRPSLGAILTASVATAAVTAAVTGVVALRRSRPARGAYSPGTVSPTAIALVQNETAGS